MEFKNPPRSFGSKGVYLSCRKGRGKRGGQCIVVPRSGKKNAVPEWNNKLSNRREVSKGGKTEKSKGEDALDRVHKKKPKDTTKEGFERTGVGSTRRRKGWEGYEGGAFPTTFKKRRKTSTGKWGRKCIWGLLSSERGLEGEKRKFGGLFVNHDAIPSAFLRVYQFRRRALDEGRKTQLSSEKKSKMREIGFLMIIVSFPRSGSGKGGKKSTYNTKNKENFKDARSGQGGKKNRYESGP